MDSTLTTPTILAIFDQEVSALGGRVTDTYHDSGQLFVRSLLPNIQPVRPQDTMQAGLALRATDDELWLHPYMFRQVCRNGAIMAQAVESLHVECLGVYSLEEGAQMLREAIANCSDEQVFARSLNRVRSAATANADELINLMPFLAKLDEYGMRRFLNNVLQRFSADGERTRFGLMNAVTSVARDTSDPDARWRLEELGGAIGALILPKRPTPSPARARAEFEPAAIT
jgi:hypothetical protein